MWDVETTFKLKNERYGLRPNSKLFMIYVFVLICCKLQDELKIDDDQFDDLQSLYQLFDIDRDGILNFKEYEKLLRCLGYRLNGKKTTFKLRKLNESLELFSSSSILLTSFSMRYLYRQV